MQHAYTFHREHQKSVLIPLLYQKQPIVCVFGILQLKFSFLNTSLPTNTNYAFSGILMSHNWPTAIIKQSDKGKASPLSKESEIRLI